MKKFYLSLVALLCGILGMNAAIDYTQLYLIGDATPGGWANPSSTSMTLVEGSDAVFTWTGILKAGSFKFVNTKSGSWGSDNFIYAAAADQAVTIGTSYPIVYNSANDYKFVIAEANKYKVTADLKNLTMKVEAVASEIPTELWITGSAVPGGTLKMENYPSLFKYFGTLNAGEVKFMTTATAQEGTTRYLVPSTAGSVVGNKLAATYTTDASTAGWTVATAADNFRITTDAINSTVTGEQFTLWEHLYIIGAAVSTGWATATAPEMTQDATDKNIYTWSGELKAASGGSKDFKFLGQRSFTGNSLHPYIADQNILDAKYVVTNPTSDYKWKIGDDGNYSIKIDLFRETISATYSVSVGISEKTADIKIVGHNGSISVLGGSVAASVSVYNACGVQVASARNVNGEVVSGLAHGLYIVEVNAPHATKVQKIVL